MIKIYKRKSSVVIFEVLMLLMALFYCTPILGSSRNLIIVGAIVGIYIVFKFEKIYIRRNEKLVTCIICYLLLVFGYRLLGISTAAWGNYMHQLSFFIVLLFMLLLSNKETYSSKALLFILLGIIAFNVVDNIRLSILYPQIHTGRVFVDEELLATINAGGPVFYNFVLFCFDIFFFVFLNTKQRLIRILMLLSAILCAVYICAFCLKASVVVYFFLSLLFIYYAKRAHNQFTFFFVLAITAIFSFIFVVFFSDELIEYIISISPDERLTTRLVTLIDPEDADANINTVTGRTNLYMLSVETWLSNIGNFFFGIGDHRAQFGAAATGIGQHSDLLDSLARYGLLGLVPLVLILKYAFKYVLSCFGKEYKLQVICILVIFLLFGLTKKIFFPSTGFAIFLLLPLMRKYVDR